MVWEEEFPTAASNWSTVAMTSSKASAGDPPSSTVRRAWPLGRAKSALAAASKSDAETARKAATAMWAAAMGEAAAEGGRE